MKKSNTLSFRDYPFVYNHYDHIQTMANKESWRLYDNDPKTPDLTYPEATITNRVGFINFLKNLRP